jgi:aldehyde dehydrogenase (NAD+)
MTSDISGLATALRRVFRTDRTRSYEWRSAQLAGLERMVREREEEICAALREDLAKPPIEAYISEIAPVINEIRHAQKHLSSWMKTERVKTPIILQPGKAVRVPEPLGVALVIAPWNYPFALLMEPLVGALAAGNCVVLKPSEVSAAASRLVADLVPRYVDPACVRVVEGGVVETTALLEQRWDHVLYTGNGAVARIVMAAAAKHLTPVTLELGGKSPVYVDRDVDLRTVARRIAWGKFNNAGQTCIAPDYVLAHETIHDALVDELGATVREFYGSNPKASRDFGRIINERHHARLVRLIASGTVVVGGDTDVAERYIAPTVLRDVRPDSPIMQEEIFGPILPVLPIDGVRSAIEFVNDRDKPLAFYVYSQERAVQREAIERASFGGATINHSFLHFGVQDLPFGGVGASGMGAYRGKSTFDTFSHYKSVFVRQLNLEPNIQYPPYDDQKAKWVRRLW